MPYFSMYYSYFYVILPAIIFALICQFKVKSAYNKYSKIPNSRHMTGAQAATELLRLNGINDVKIEMVAGTLSDHFDPRTKTIRLSQDIFNGTSIASIGIACHEAGHACQYDQGYFPMKIRSAIIPVTNIGSMLGFPLAIGGLLLNVGILIDIGLVLYATVSVFQFITLPVEFNASRRALKVIEEHGMLSGDEYTGAKKMLVSAALTYVAALVSSLASLLRLLLIVGGRRDD